MTHRRAFLSAGIASGGALALGAASWRPWSAIGTAPATPGLRPDPQGVFDLVEGLEYRVLQRVGQRMSDGHPAPGAPDGMACFADGDRWVLCRNHELPLGLAHFAHLDRERVYRADAGGGVSRLVLHPRTLEVESSNMVLAGTVYNCSGGPSPFGWLSCEETTERGHGFVFACDPGAASVQAPRKIAAYGRFKHEAVAVRPDSRVAYLTEDQKDGCFYRFVPHDPALPFEGRLQALVVRGRPGADTATLALGDDREIGWVDLPDPSADTQDLRFQARSLGAARVARGEGVCQGENGVHFCATIGGPRLAGQIFTLEDGPDGGVLRTRLSSRDPSEVDMPDNITVGPGNALFFVEDGSGHDHLRALTSDGRLLTFARHALSDSELTGICFSPDLTTCFVNAQKDGLTLAIRGPWNELLA